jgi:hypothetical protein
MKPTPGYSGTPLPKKLGIKPGTSVCVVDEPPGYRKWLSPLPEGVTFLSSPTAEVDLIHLFAKNRCSLAVELKRTLVSIRPDAAIWVSWPKKASKVVTDITDNVIRDLALPLGLVDIKVCAVSEIWSGLKFVIRTDLRKNRR